MNGGEPLTNVAALELGPGYLYLAPGTYSVALVTAGQGLRPPFSARWMSRSPPAIAMRSPPSARPRTPATPRC